MKIKITVAGVEQEVDIPIEEIIATSIKPLSDKLEAKEAEEAKALNDKEEADRLKLESDPEKAKALLEKEKTEGELAALKQQIADMNKKGASELLSSEIDKSVSGLKFSETGKNDFLFRRDEIFEMNDGKVTTKAVKGIAAGLTPKEYVSKYMPHSLEVTEPKKVTKEYDSYDSYKKELASKGISDFEALVADD